MTVSERRFFLILLVVCLSAGPAFSQETQGTQTPEAPMAPDAPAAPEGQPSPQAPGEPSLVFGLALGIGVQSFNELGSPVVYQSLSLAPDLAFGKFGIGLALTLNFRFTGAGQLEIRKADWIPSSFTDFLAIYLPKIAYVRWGLKGEPLYIKAGSFADATLGNGFIMSDYSNTLFLPDTRIFGLTFDLNGALFGFPFLGMETVVGNLAQFDVIGGRIYTRPLITTAIPILENLELGGTFVTDTKPYLYSSTQTGATAIFVFGGDFRLPILSNPIISLAVFGDVASIAGRSSGEAVGFGGRLIGFLTYGAQFRVIGANFIPTYFGSTYDLLRTAQYDVVQLGAGTATTLAWFATIGTSFMDDKFIFNAGLDGPFSPPYPNARFGDPEYFLNYPHLRGVLTLADGVLPGFSLDFSYDKKGIATWADLVSPVDSAIRAQLNYKAGPAILSLIYMVRYAPEQTGNPWVVTSGLQSSIQLF